MSENLLTWSVRNWITVFLMVVLGWAIIGAAARLVRGKKSTLPDDSNTAAGAFIQ